MSKCTPCKLWYSVQNCGDGSAYPRLFLNEKDATKDQDDQEEGWGETCIGSFDSYGGSNSHTEAQNNSVAINTTCKSCNKSKLQCWC